MNLESLLSELHHTKEHGWRANRRFINFLGDPPVFFWDLDPPIRHTLVTVDCWIAETFDFGPPGNWHDLDRETVESVRETSAGRDYPGHNDHYAISWYGQNYDYWLHLLAYHPLTGYELLHETKIWCSLEWKQNSDFPRGRLWHLPA